MNQPLILLFGMPRSGTTWIGKIFDSQPNTLYRHEPDSRGTLNTLPIFAYTQDAEKYRSFLNGYVANLPRIRDEKVSASVPIFTKDYYNAPQWALRKGMLYGAKVASRLLGSLPVPDVVNTAHRADVTVVWKSIESLGRLGLLAKNFPKSRCLLILRHPCGYVASVLRGTAQRKFVSGIAPFEDWEIYRLLLDLPVAKERGLDLAAVKTMEPVERMALIWALYYEHALTETAGLDNVLAIRYEDFCEHPQTETQAAFRHCRLPWASETEHFIVSSTSRENSAYYSVFKDPKVAAYKWKEELSAEDVGKIMAIVAPFKAASYYP